jgi:hypothetical protein
MITKLLSAAVLAITPMCVSDADACKRVFRSSTVIQSFAPAQVLVPTVSSCAVVQHSCAQQAVAHQVFNHVAVQAVQVPVAVHVPVAVQTCVSPVAVQQVRTRTVVRSRSRIFNRRRGW